MKQFHDRFMVPAFAAAFLVLTGCVPSSGPPPVLNAQFVTMQPAPADATGSAAARFAAAQADPATEGLLHVYREDRFVGSAVKTAVSIDGNVVSAFQHGVASFPIARGTYEIAIKYGISCDSIMAESGCEENPFPYPGHTAEMTIHPGEEIFLRLQAIDQRPGYAFVQETAEIFQAATYAPAEMRVARIAPPVPSDAEQRQEFVRKTLKPATVERDRLVLQIGDLINKGEIAATLPLFDRLNALPVPIDPTVDFYWGWALLDAGETSAGRAKLNRFARRIDATSPLYRTTLRLLAETEQS